MRRQIDTVEGCFPEPPWVAGSVAKAGLQKGKSEIKNSPKAGLSGRWKVEEGTD